MGTMNNNLLMSRAALGSSTKGMPTFGLSPKKKKILKKTDKEKHPNIFEALNNRTKK